MSNSGRDDARSVLSDPRAPADERFDAEAQMTKAHMPTISDLVPSAQIMEVIDFIQNDLNQRDLMMKGGAQVIPFPGDPQRRKKGMQSTYVDDLQVFTSGQGRDKPSPIGFQGLREMVEQTPILAAIVNTRIRQIGRFCQPSEDGGEGFEIRHMDRKHKLTGAEKERARLLGRFIQNNGWEFNPRKRKALKRESFSQFMKKSVRDSLSFDACPIEVEWKNDRSKGLDGFYGVDGATISLTTDEGYEGDPSIRALQEVESRVTTVYTADDLIYEVRNPRTDVRLAGYGYGETEQLVRVVTGFLNAMTMNANGFDYNAIPKGILHLNGDYDTSDLASFKRSWNAQVKGINGRWAVPVMVSKDPNSKGASFERIDADFNEMMFAKWTTFLVSLACAIYGMSPSEVNFDSFADSKSSLSGDSTEEKLTSSRDLGLHPDMAFYEAMFTDFVVAEFDTDLCFRWVGLREEDEKWNQEATKLVSTVDELRAAQGMEAWPDKGSALGSAPLNQALVAAWQAEQQAKNPQPGGDFGGAAPPPPPGKPDFGDPDGQGGEQDGQPGAGNPDAAAGAAGAADVEGAQPEFGGGGASGDFGKAFSTIFAIGGE